MFGSLPLADNKTTSLIVELLERWTLDLSLTPSTLVIKVFGYNFMP